MKSLVDMINFQKEVKPFFENQGENMENRFNKEYEFLIVEVNNEPYIFDSVLSRIIYNTDKQEKALPKDKNCKSYKILKKRGKTIEGRNLTHLEDYCAYFESLTNKSRTYQNKLSLYNYIKYSYLPRHYSKYPYNGLNELGEYDKTNIYKNDKKDEIKISSAFIDDTGTLYLDTELILSDLNLYPKIVNGETTYHLATIRKDILFYKPEYYQKNLYNKVYLSEYGVITLIDRILGELWFIAEERFCKENHLTEKSYDKLLDNNFEKTYRAIMDIIINDKILNSCAETTIKYYKWLITEGLPLYLRTLAINNNVIKDNTELQHFEYPMGDNFIEDFYKEKFDSFYDDLYETNDIIDMNEKLIKNYKRKVKDTIIDRHSKLFINEFMITIQDENFLKESKFKKNFLDKFEFIISENKTWYLLSFISLIYENAPSVEDLLKYVEDSEVRFGNIDRRNRVLISAKGIREYLSKYKYANTHKPLCDLILKELDKIERNFLYHRDIIDEIYKFRYINNSDIKKILKKEVTTTTMNDIVNKNNEDADYKLVQNEKSVDLNFCLTLSENLWIRLKDYSKKFQIPIKDITETALSRYLEEKKTLSQDYDKLSIQMEELRNQAKI